MNEPQKLGIALIPDPISCNAVIQLQQQIFCATLQPRLGLDHNLPHMTLLQGRFRDEQALRQFMEQLQCYLQQIERQQPQFLSFQKLQCTYKSPHWYFLRPIHIQFNLNWQEIHQFCFENLKENLLLTESDRQKDLTGYTEAEKLNYLQYGYRYIGQDFDPHFTLGQTKDRDAVIQLNEWISSSPRLPIKGKFERVTLYSVGSYGSHDQALMDFKIDRSSATLY